MREPHPLQESKELTHTSVLAESSTHEDENKFQNFFFYFFTHTHTHTNTLFI